MAQSLPRPVYRHPSHTACSPEGNLGFFFVFRTAGGWGTWVLAVLGLQLGHTARHTCRRTKRGNASWDEKGVCERTATEKI